jgi:hypothetical protein
MGYPELTRASDSEGARRRGVHAARADPDAAR